MDYYDDDIDDANEEYLFSDEESGEEEEETENKEKQEEKAYNTDEEVNSEDEESDSEIEENIETKGEVSKNNKKHNYKKTSPYINKYDFPRIMEIISNMIENVPNFKVPPEILQKAKELNGNVIVEDSLEIAKVWLLYNTYNENTTLPISVVRKRLNGTSDTINIENLKLHSVCSYV